jgi:hypothetical protein
MADEKVDDTVDAEVDENEDTEQDGEGEDEAQPTKAELERLRRASKRASNEAKKWREKFQESQKSKDGERKPEDIEADALAKAEEKFKPMLVREAAKRAFMEAGLTLPKGKESSALARAIKMLDMSEIDYEDGEVAGLDDEIERVKDEWPELFASPSASRNGGGRGVDARSGGRPVKKEKSIGEQLEDQIMRSRR